MSNILKFLAGASTVFFLLVKLTRLDVIDTDGIILSYALKSCFMVNEIMVNGICQTNVKDCSTHL